MPTLKLTLAYDGTQYHGWQRQPNGRTLQETLDEALGRITGERVRTVASGRTDAGVHALGQVVHFHAQSRLSPGEITQALNATLPDDFVVRGCEAVPDDFHARYHAKRKLYRYVFDDGPHPDPFLRRYCWHTKPRLDAGAMHRAAASLTGTHDFHSYESHWPNRSSSVRTVSLATVERVSAGAIWHTAPLGKRFRKENVVQNSDEATRLIVFEIEANGFLYNMVRALAGTLYNVGRGYWPERKVQEILAAQDRRQAGPTAPPQGLFLVRVEY